MTTIEQQKAAYDFVQEWQGKGYEKGETQKFWLELLQDVLGKTDVFNFIEFEDKVLVDNQNFMDAYIPKTRVLIEQKSLGKNLGEPIKQSDGSLLNPFQQAKKYILGLPVSKHPRWVVTCNFREFWVYDMEQPNGEPQKIALANLGKEYYRLQFLVDEGNEHLRREMEVSVKAGELVGMIYDQLLKQYRDADGSSAKRGVDGSSAKHTAGEPPASQEILRSLNILCVRLVFCLYAEDAGLFPTRTSFHDYLANYKASQIRSALIRLFEVLDTPLDRRDPYLDEDLAVFPYVNGGLFGNVGSQIKQINQNVEGQNQFDQFGKFVNKNIIIPQFTEDLKTLILEKASADFDWSEISPTIFGAVFESTLNPETRRSGGMHYTSIENIHKVIDPLFLNDLRKEFESIVGTVETQRAVSLQGRAVSLQVKQRLAAFQDKLASLTFLDPACGSGNFLTETFLSLRRLENEVIQAMYGGTRQLNFEGTIKVNISQFYGIEINDFACTVAKTALWIAESQTLHETSSIIGVDLNFLPLKTNAYIHEGNALRMDWAELFTNNNGSQIKQIDQSETADEQFDNDGSQIKQINQSETADEQFDNNGSQIKQINQNEAADEQFDKFGQFVNNKYPDYIIGNPPFVGGMMMTREQKQEMIDIFGKEVRGIGELDYVGAWYKKAADMMASCRDTARCVSTGGQPKHIKAAFVSTNSITQGEQVAILWKPLMKQYGAQIDFAYRTFRWDSEADIKAHVHCVIVGFSIAATVETQRAVSLQAVKRIFLSDNQSIPATNINGYLLDAPDVFIHNRSTPLCDVPPMNFGNMPRDGGGFILSEEEKDELIQKDPLAAQWVHLFLGAAEFINNKKRYCLWLQGANPAELRQCPIVMSRIESVRQMRAESKAASTRKMAETPTLFAQITQPLGVPFLIVPRVSSERRRYVPMGFLSGDVISSDAVQIIPNATLYHFGILTSNVHMAWMRAVCGRLKSDYRYSKDIVYNNFPWCDCPAPCTPSPQADEGESRADRNADAIIDTNTDTTVDTNISETNVINSPAPLAGRGQGGGAKTHYERISQTAQAILDARQKYLDQGCSLADLYDENAMPPELRRAHQDNDRAVMAAYGFSTKMTESECVAELFKMYEQLIKTK